MKNITVTASACKGGKVLTKVLVDFPQNIREAIEKYGEKEVFGYFVRNKIIEVQGQMRAEYKAPLTGSGRTKAGSALDQLLSDE